MNVTIFKMAGSGFASTVRLAKSSPEMWTPIFKQNKENILEVLKEYISNLKDFEHLIRSLMITDQLFKQMKDTNAIKLFWQESTKKT